MTAGPLPVYWHELSLDEQNAILEERYLTQQRDFAFEKFLLIASQLPTGGIPLVDFVHGLAKRFSIDLGIDDREEYEAYKAKRRVSNRQPLSRGITRAVWDRDGWLCQDCGTNKNLSVDHIVPVVNGGSNDMSNLQTLCIPCNSSKGAR